MKWNLKKNQKEKDKTEGLVISSFCFTSELKKACSPSFSPIYSKQPRAQVNGFVAIVDPDFQTIGEFY